MTKDGKLEPNMRLKPQMSNRLQIVLHEKTAHKTAKVQHLKSLMFAEQLCNFSAMAFVLTNDKAK